jgi:hypothetical protein
MTEIESNETKEGWHLLPPTRTKHSTSRTHIGTYGAVKAARDCWVEALDNAGSRTRWRARWSLWLKLICVVTTGSVKPTGRRMPPVDFRLWQP